MMTIDFFSRCESVPWLSTIRMGETQSASESAFTFSRAIRHFSLVNGRHTDCWRRTMPKLALFLSISVTAVAVTGLAEADDARPDPTIPVLIHAGSDLVLLDDFSCLHAACDGRVTPGRHHVTVKVEKDGDWVIDLERSVDIFAPTEIDVHRPGLLRKMAVATTAFGGAIVVVGFGLPLLSLYPKSTVDQTTGKVKTNSNFFENASTSMKVAWIASIGVGMSLALIGAVSLAMTSGESRIRSRRWAVAPFPHLYGRDGTGMGVGFVTDF